MSATFCKIQLPILFVICASNAAVAGVRHSRSINGTGQPIPKNQFNRPSAVDPNINQGIPVPNQFQPPQTQEQPGLGQSSPPLQSPPPMIIPPPMPVQIPTQAGSAADTQPSTDLSTSAQLPIAPQTPVAAPVPVAPQTPVAAPVPVGSVQQTGGQSVTPPTPVVVPPPMQVEVPKQMKEEPRQQLQAPDSSTQIPVLPPVLQSEGLPNTPAHPPEKSQFASPSQNFIPDSLETYPTDPTLQGGQLAIPYQGQPNLAPAPAGRMMGGRYLTSTYGMAGCGLGSMVFKENQRSQQWLASIINEVIIPQSLPITTGTSNCFDVDEELSQAEQEVFIDTNFHTLKTDVVRGDGETLRAYADLVGCYKDDLYDTFASLSQGQYGFIFSDSLPQSVAERFRNSLKRSRALKTRCDRLF